MSCDRISGPSSSTGSTTSSCSGRSSRDDLDAIVALQIARLRTLVAARGLALDVTPRALQWLGEAGYDPLYGARPLKRVIQRELQNPIAMEVLQGSYAEGDTITVDVGPDGLVFAASDAPGA